jgi:hypothetical protein
LHHSGFCFAAASLYTAVSVPDPIDTSDNEHTLPRERARRRSGNKNEWLAADAAERRRPIIALVIVGAIAAVGLALMTGLVKV